MDYKEFKKDLSELYPGGDKFGFHAEDDLEKIAEWVDIESGTIRRDFMHEEKRKHTESLKQIIKKKYFKPPLEINLLTWAAKEQIRFLHAEDPAEWTIEKLASSFPISRDGVIKLLRGTFTCETPEEIEKHDRRVFKHWELLNKISDGKVDKGGPLSEKFQSLLESGKIELMLNASGIKSLPMPPNNSTKTVVPAGRKLSTSKQKSRIQQISFGIIYDAYAEHMKKVSIPVSEKSKSKELHNQNKLLENIVLKLQKKDQKSRNIRYKSDNTYQQKTETTMENFDRLESYAYEKDDEYKLHQSNKSKYNDTESLYDVMADLQQQEIRETRKVRNLSRREMYRNKRKAVLAEETSSGNDIESPELKGTGRIKKSHNVNGTGDSSELVVNNEELEFQKRFDEPPAHINVPARKYKKGAVYQVGKAFYDAQGEYLYSLP